MVYHRLGNNKWSQTPPCFAFTNNVHTTTTDNTDHKSTTCQAMWNFCGNELGHQPLATSHTISSPCVWNKMNECELGKIKILVQKCTQMPLKQGILSNWETCTLIIQETFSTNYSNYSNIFGRKRFMSDSLKSFYAHHSVHRESIPKMFQQDDTLVQYFIISCKSLYMFRVKHSPIIRSLINL
jgi:hypothetical protein